MSVTLIAVAVVCAEMVAVLTKLSDVVAVSYVVTIADVGSPDVSSLVMTVCVDGC